MTNNHNNDERIYVNEDKDATANPFRAIKKLFVLKGRKKQIRIEHEEMTEFLPDNSVVTTETEHVETVQGRILRFPSQAAGICLEESCGEFLTKDSFRECVICSLVICSLCSKKVADLVPLCKICYKKERRSQFLRTIGSFIVKAFTTTD